MGKFHISQGHNWLWTVKPTEVTAQTEQVGLHSCHIWTVHYKRAAHLCYIITQDAKSLSCRRNIFLTECEAHQSEYLSGENEEVYNP